MVTGAMHPALVSGACSLNSSLIPGSCDACAAKAKETGGKGKPTGSKKRGLGSSDQVQRGQGVRSGKKQARLYFQHRCTPQSAAIHSIPHTTVFRRALRDLRTDRRLEPALCETAPPCDA